MTEGIVIPRVERSSSAGLVTSIATESGTTEIEANLFRGSVGQPAKLAQLYPCNMEQMRRMI